MTKRSGSSPRPTAGRPDGSTNDQRLLDTRGPSDWVHTDPWRVLKIQAEFVEGFNDLAEIGPAISVFGSARTPAGHASYEMGVKVGAALAQAGFAVITGGGRPEHRARHRAALGGEPQPVRHLRPELPLLLRPQDDVREVRPGLRGAPRRPRHARRAVRGDD